MMRTRPPPILTEAVRPIPALGTGSAWDLAVQRFGRRVNNLPILVPVMLMRLQRAFIGSNAMQWCGHGRDLRRRCRLALCLRNWHHQSEREECSEELRRQHVFSQDGAHVCRL